MSHYTEIENYIKRNEVNKRTRLLEENQDILTNYWNIGRILVEAQGGEKRAKYGNGLIKEWSAKFTEKYGKGYNYTNLSRFRQFYLYFPILATVSQLSWSQLVILLPIQDENKRNYYINQCIEKSLSVRELRCEIKNNSYERLVQKPGKIEIVSISNKETIVTNMKNPILLELKENFISNEHDLEVCILSQLKNFFNQLGEGFLFADNQLKKSFHNATIGIIISKEQNKLIANFVESERIIPLTYKIMQ